MVPWFFFAMPTSLFCYFANATYQSDKIEVGPNEIDEINEQYRYEMLLKMEEKPLDWEINCNSHFFETGEVSLN